MTELRVKVLIIGDSSVGKTSLASQYVQETFQICHTPTIGIQYKQKTIQLPDKSTLRVQIWDTAGTQRFKTITPNYYRNVDGVLIVYDITDDKSFETIDYWLGELNDNADVANLEMFIIGNKTDLREKRVVPVEKGRQAAEKMGIDHHETTATDFQGTREAFDMLIKKILVRKKIPIEKDVCLSKPTKNGGKKKVDCCEN